MILDDFTVFYKPFAAECTPAGIRSSLFSAKNTSPDFLNMSFHDLVHFIDFGGPRRPPIYFPFVIVDFESGSTWQLKTKKNSSEDISNILWWERMAGYFPA